MSVDEQVKDWGPAPAEASQATPAGRLAGRLLSRLVIRLRERWPAIRRTLPRDLVLLLWAALLLQHYSLGWVATDSVNTSLVLIHKSVAPKPGELAVFGYAGGQIPDYYPESIWTQARRAVGMDASRAGPRKGDGFVKYLIGVPGDRIEVRGQEVVLHNSQGVWSMGRCKPESRQGQPLECTKPKVIPAGYAYAWAPHADALDSRYEVMGLVPTSSIAGKAVRLW